MRPKTMVFAMVIAAWTASADAQIVYLDQFREVAASVFVPGESSEPDVVSSVLGGMFDESVAVGVDGDGGFASALASQMSNLGAGSIWATGEAFGFGSTDGNGLGVTRLEATFSLGDAAAYSFTASFFDLNLGNPLNMGIILADAGGEKLIDLDQSDLGADVGDVMLDPIGGVMAAGEYTLTFFIRADGHEDAAVQIGYDWVLAVPTPGSVILVGAAFFLAVFKRRRVRIV